MLTRRHLLAGAAALTATPGSTSATHIRIGFVGNSFTLQHNVPEMVRRLLDSVWFDSFSFNIETFARNGAYLADRKDPQAALGLARRDSQHFGILVLQDHSTSALTHVKRTQSLAAIRRFNDLAVNTTLFATWPRRADHQLYRQPGMPRSAVDMVEQTEAHLANAMGSETSDERYRIAPVGRAWLLADDIDLYAADGYHANISGAWLSALVLARAITGKNVDAVAPKGVKLPDRLAEIARFVVP
ncbi:MAG: hypothetical protein AB8B85_09740 [Paracoccaceae bacterium]